MGWPAPLGRRLRPAGRLRGDRRGAAGLRALPQPRRPREGRPGMRRRRASARASATSATTSSLHRIGRRPRRPWGIMVDAEDPLTGEKIAGSVNQWGATLDRAAAQLVDLVELLNGGTSPDKFIAGQGRLRLGGGEPARRRRRRSPQPMSARRAHRAPGRVRPQVDVRRSRRALRKARRAGPQVAQHRARMKDLETAGKLGPGNAALARPRRASCAAATSRPSMVTPEIAQLAGFDPTEPVSKTRPRDAPLRSAA